MTEKSPVKRRVLVKSWGCQMNAYDAARMADLLTPLGYEKTNDPALADLVILNTCHIREKASEKLFSDLGRLAESKKERAARGFTTTIAVAGCVAQAAEEEIIRRAPFVELIFGPQTYHRLPEMLARVARANGVVLDTEFPPEPKFDFLPRAHNATGVAAFLPVQEGCDRFCSYCVVPYTRGAEYSRTLDSVKAEAEDLIACGARELTLLGQNVNAYRDPDTKSGLGGLIEELAGLRGLERLRYTTSHPCSMDDALIAAHASVPCLMPFLHLPLQSGSDRILDAMNRKHTFAQYMATVEKIRKARPDMAFSSDFIVGFPGETEEDFEATLRAVENVGYAQAFSFKYSPRHGTPAAALTEQVTEDVKEERLARLQTLLRAQQTAFNKACANAILPVLFEGLSDREGYVFGRTPFMQTARAIGTAELVGKVLPFRVVKTSPNSLLGSVKD